jgi:hypothetical protein
MKLFCLYLCFAFSLFLIDAASLPKPFSSSHTQSTVAPMIESTVISTSRDLKTSFKLRSPINKDTAMLQIQRHAV